MTVPMSRGKRWLAATGALALAIAGLASGVTAASAVPVPENLPAANAEGTLTIHKRASQLGATASNPSTIPVPGAGFTLYSLDVGDLTTPGAWSNVSDLVLDGCDATLSGSSVKGAAVGSELITDVDGDVTSGTLPLGAYLVCETTPVAEITTADGTKQLVLKSDPFIVTIPYPDSSASDGWDYAVDVWPKNSYNTFTKEIVDNTHHIGPGDEVSFNVIAEIPVVDGNNTLTSFDISDYFDKWLDDVKLDSVTVGGNPVDASAYTSTMEQVDGRWLSWVRFDPTEIAAFAGQKVTVTYTATVLETIGSEDFPGTVENQAYQFTNTPGTDSTTKPDEVTPPDPEIPGTPSPVVYELWAPLDILKFEQGDADKTRIDGAEFDVFETAGDPYADTCSTTPAGSRVTTITSSTSVDVTWLYINDSNNTEANSGATGGDDLADLAKTRCYVLVETKAPAGYILDTTPRAVKMVYGQTASQPVQAEIPNVKADVPELPLTGGAGQAALVIGGLALVGIAALLMTARRRKAQIEA